MDMSISIKFLPENVLVEASQDETLLEVALREHLDISHSCGGNGTCGTCRVWILKGVEQLPPRNEVELEIATDRGFGDHERLACQNLAVPELVVKIPKADLAD